MKQKVFNGALNQDIAPKFLREEDYVGATNIIFQASKDGNAGILRRYPGFTTATANPGTVLPENPVVIGTYENRAERVVYFFVSGSDSDGIYKYNPTINEYEAILYKDLNFNQSNLITGIGMIGDLLFWTDNLNEPRAINVTRDYSTYLEQDITIIKPAPNQPLSYSFLTNVSAAFSLLTNKVYDFSYRYIYLDNQVSVIAPYTTQVFCSEASPLIVGIQLSKPTHVEVPLSVGYVEILVRKSDQDQWQIFKKMTRDEFINDVIVFEDDILGIPVATAETIKYFESAPVKSKALEIARDRVFLGNNTEGYDLYSIPSLAASLETSDTSTEVKNLPVYIQNITTLEEDYSVGFDPSQIIYTQTIETNYYIVDGPRYYFFKEGQILEYPGPVETRPSQYTGTETAATVDYANFVSFDDLNYTQTTGTQGQGAFYTTSTSSTSPVNPEHLVSTTINLQGSVGATKFKNGAQYQIGIVFYDDYLRNAGVYTNPSCIVTINDDFRNSDVSYLKWTLNVSDNLQIPTWATSYQIVRTDNLTKNTFVQGKTSDIYYVRTFQGEEFYERSYNSEMIAIEIDISGSFEGGLRYNFTPGDLIEIDVIAKVITRPIIGVVGSRIRIEPFPEFYFEDPLSTPYPRRFFYEIYSLKQVTIEKIFYEVGSAHRISQPGTIDRSFTDTEGFLTGDTQVVSADHYDYPDTRTPTSGVFDTNDLVDTIVPITIEAGNVLNDTTIGWLKGLGRLNTVVEIGQSVKKTAVRWSNRFIQGTKINGTSGFEVNDEKQLPIEIVEINKLQLTSKTQQEGTVMLAICTNECTSMYLGETQFVDNVNQALIGSTTNVIGTVNVLSSGAGTIHPESVIHHNGRVWWWDFYNSRVLRYDPNGIRDLSEIGMKSYFYGKGTPTTGYDPFHNLFFIGFGGDFLSFDEQSNQWRSFYTFRGEFISKAEDFMVLFRNGLPHKSNSEGYFYPGTIDEYGTYEFYASYPSPQVLDNISIYTTDVFTWINANQVMADLFEILVTNQEGQQTDLVYTDFDIIESVLHAQFYRDINSKGGLRDGEAMRSDVHKFKITITGDIGFETIAINDTESSGH